MLCARFRRKCRGGKNARTERVKRVSEKKPGSLRETPFPLSSTIIPRDLRDYTGSK